MAHVQIGALNDLKFAFQGSEDQLLQCTTMRIDNFLLQRTISRKITKYIDRPSKDGTTTVNTGEVSSGMRACGHAGMRACGHAGAPPSDLEAEPRQPVYPSLLGSWVLAWRAPATLSAPLIAGPTKI
jgi:hypothetical protein